MIDLHGLQDVKPIIKMQETIGLYPIVDHADWVRRLLKVGVRTIQLRMKNQTEEVVRHNVQQAVELAHAFKAQLFINDYWQLAIECGAYGVHLGQEDLIQAEVDQIYSAGLRLGVSTHEASEIKNALTVRPSYLAYGPIYHTNTKVMPYVPRGIVTLQKICQSICLPIVAIGGIGQQNIQQVLSEKVDGVAMISEIVHARQPEKQTKALLEYFK